MKLSQISPRSSFITAILKIFELEETERYKFYIGALTFFCVIASYSLTNVLQSIVFTAMVGYEYVPVAKLFTLFIFTFAILIDAALVDRFKRYQIFIIYSSIFSLLGFVFAYLLGLPDIGMDNTVQSTNRWLAWAFFVYIEGFMPFIVGVFWALLSSINIPKSAERTYGLIVACSKAGGALSTLAAYILLTYPIMWGIEYSDTEKIQILVAANAVFLGLAPLVLTLMIRKVKLSELKGYQQIIDPTNIKTGIVAGFKMFATKPYVLGIFLLLFFCEALNEVVTYQRLKVVVEQSGGAHNLSIISAALFWQVFVMHVIGFFIAIIGTNGSLRLFGIRASIMIMPIITAILVFFYIILEDPTLIIVLYIVLHALNYTIGMPMRESLYVVTSRDIQFKAKFAIDVFGLKCSKGFGHLFNYMNNRYILTLLGAQATIFATNIFFVVILVLWVLVAFLTGKRYSKAIERNELIK